MKSTRVIPVLLLKNGGLVKGESFKNHKYVGDPINAVRIFNEKEVNELAILDISAGLEGRDPDYISISDIASEAFMPIAYGGGIRSFDQVRKLFRLGIEKVIINTEFYRNPSFVTSCTDSFGSQSICVSLDIKKSLLGSYNVYVRNGSERIDVNPVEYAQMAQAYGAGEILLTLIDREGSGRGIDTKIVRSIVSSVQIPVIAHGGVGSLQNISDIVKFANPSAVAAGSFFTFYGKHKAVLLTYPSHQELKNLSSL